jgi:hypothetical protein
MPSSKEGSLGGHSKSANAGKEQNTVHDDAIWRQVIRYELDWSRNWQQKWGFMKESNEKVCIVIYNQIIMISYIQLSTTINRILS